MTLTLEQVAGYLGVFFGTGLGALLFYRNKYNKEPLENRKVAEDLVMSSGVIADMKPVRQAAASLDRIADTMDRALDLMKDEMEERIKLRHVLSDIRQSMEGSARSAQAAEHRTHRQEDRT